MTKNDKLFNNRAYGFVVIKSINSNYNADFSGLPRTLPDGTVYATDKALKYTIRNYMVKNYENERVFYFKRLKNEDQNPFTLVEAYDKFFESSAAKDSKRDIIANLLSAIDVRLFGSTFAPKATNVKDKNISIHGPVQINHGKNIWLEGNIYSEQIMSPFRNPGEKHDDDSASTLGRQSKLEEGHYVHHFSINPKNLYDIASHGMAGTQVLSERDIEILKESLRKGATYYDSAAKAGTENEILFYVELVEGSKVVLPNFTEMIQLSESKENGMRYFDLEKVKSELEKYASEIAKCEIYYNKNSTAVDNLPNGCTEFELN